MRPAPLPATILGAAVLLAGCAAAPGPARTEPGPARSEEGLEREVVRRWHDRADEVARSMASSEHTLEEVLGFLDGPMSDEVLRRVTRDVQEIEEDLRPQDVRALWDEREGGPWLRATYGSGTWLLGEEAALAGRPAQEPQAELAGRQEERADFAAKIDRWLEDQEALRESRRGAEIREERETAWRRLGAASRSQWILADYVEHSGDMRVQPELQACGDCGGTGVRAVVIRVAAADRSRLVECPTCHHIGVVRLVRYH